MHIIGCKSTAHIADVLSRTLILLCVLVMTAPGIAQTEKPIDSDLDGISDDVEQSLLEQFRPRLMVSRSDCAGLPARFASGVANPKLVAADGTIYGQVSPAKAISPSAVELHYYTIWSRDCGRMSHPFDVEHLAALISLEGSAPKALYWYAGAHEKTVCDISSGARASAVDSISKGPQVWSSSGKHAFYFRQSMCNTGCGADRCDDNVELSKKEPVINLGEVKTPANDSLFAASPTWPLAEKMTSDFSAEVIARIDAAPDEIATLRGSRTMRGTIQGSDTVVDTAAVGARHTGAALDTAHDQTSNSLGKATRATGRSLKRAWNAVFNR